MPANLTAQYRNAEKAWRNATTLQEELACLENMLREIPKHKGTDKLQADLKQKISRLKVEVTRQKKPAGGNPSNRIPRHGAGRAIIIGGPNSGKSSLLAALTKATPAIAPYPFTTRQPFPGMMPWEDLQVQLIDTPPITADLFDNEVVSMVRGADVVVLMLDLASDNGCSELQEVIRQFANSKTRLGADTCVDGSDVGTTWTATILVPNKTDLPGAENRLAFFAEFLPATFPAIPVSCECGNGLDQLRATIFERCDCIRVYTRQPGKKQADMDNPFALKRGSTLVELAELIHRDLLKSLKGARVWKQNAHDPKIVKPDHELEDRDIVELVGG